MDDRLCYEQLQVGDRWESPARTVTETDVAQFSRLTGDCDPLHVDPDAARQSPFGRPVAHGLLGLAFAAGLAIRCPAVRTLALVSIPQWEFRLPIFPGDQIRTITEVAALGPAGRRGGRVLWNKRLLNQRNELVQQGRFETLVARRVPGGSPGRLPSSASAPTANPALRSSSP